jgi:hypothetical protein
MARKVNTKVCTFTKVALPATPENFYRDKSQKDGLSPWSKAGEAAYNNAYHKALKALGATRVKDLDDASRVKFNAAMKRAKVRIARTGRASATKATTSRKRTAKASA